MSNVFQSVDNEPWIALEGLGSACLSHVRTGQPRTKLTACSAMTSHNLLQHHIFYNFDFCAFNTPSSFVASITLLRFRVVCVV